MREYSLDVIKNGVCVDTIDLHERIARGKKHQRDAVIFGRDPPHDDDHHDNDDDGHDDGETGPCHVRLEHASISRLHLAVRRCDNAGQVEVEDLESVHGSFINGKRLRARAKYVIRDGDVLCFGASTRMYVVNEKNRNDHQHDGDNDEKSVDKHAQQHHLLVQQEENEAAKVTDDAMRAQREADAMLSAMEYDDEGRFKWKEYLARYQGTLSLRQQKIVEKLYTKDMRVRNLMKEVENINRKADEKALTDGQRRQRCVRNPSIVLS